MNLQQYPNWVRNNPQKYVARLALEAKELYSKFPHIGIYMDEGQILRLEGNVVTCSKNMYRVRILYPGTYPTHKPESYVLDHDVIAFCGKSENMWHRYHNYGIDPNNGVRLCLMDADDRVNKGWTPNQTGVSILDYTLLWLHAYEYKRVRGHWPLPE